jgi:hypothetical protein
VLGKTTVALLLSLELGMARKVFLASCFAVKFASACFMCFLCLGDDILLVIAVLLCGLRLCLTVEVTMSWLLTSKSLRLMIQ